MTSGDSTVWIEDGEKYALIGLSVNVDGVLPPREITPNLWVRYGGKFDLPPHWREWLGNIRTEQVENCNLLLFSKQASSTPDVLDADNQRLQHRVEQFYNGLILASTFAPAYRPVMLTGSRRDAEIDVRQQHDFDAPVPRLVRRYPPILSADIQLAAELGVKLEALAAAPPAGGNWRLFRTLDIYLTSRTNLDILD